MTRTLSGQKDMNRRPGMRVVRKVVPYLWPPGRPGVKVRVLLALAALVIARGISVYTPLLYKGAVDALAPVADAAAPALLLGMGAIGLTLAYGVLRLMSVGFNQLRDVIFARVGQRAMRRLALETFRHLHALSLRYHISRKTGGLSRIIERGVKGVDFLLRYLLFSIGPLILELVMIAAVLFFLFDWRYLAVVVVTLALYFQFTFRVTEWRVKIRQEMNTQDTNANQKAIDSLLNFETVKYFGAEAREAERYDDSMRAYEGAALRTSYSLAFLNFGQSFLITGGLVAVMVIAATGVQNGDLTVGDFVMVNAYMIQITMPLNFLGTVYREVRQALVDMADMFDLLEQPAEVVDKPGARDISVSGGRIEFDNVVFGYDRDRRILHGLSLTVNPGETVAVVGPSGSGKSTVARLLFRFYDVEGGAIRIDGQDLRDVTQDSLHRVIGIVPQDTVLFNDTVGYNIAYGREGADKSEVTAAARAAKIHDFIASLPTAYDTTVGERGLKLSGGEKQRVGLARTLLKNPPILLLDEATSALDTKTERSIQDSLRDMRRGRSVIIIAHRLSTVVDADRIIVLENGLVAEQGSHEALLHGNGRYAHMWHSQQAEENEGPVQA